MIGVVFHLLGPVMNSGGVGLQCEQTYEKLNIYTKIVKWSVILLHPYETFYDQGPRGSLYDF